ncbi:hypothetical protein VTN96DRAFT_1335 [Rasamsonia emersonii]
MRFLATISRTYVQSSLRSHHGSRLNWRNEEFQQLETDRQLTVRVIEKRKEYLAYPCFQVFLIVFQFRESVVQGLCEMYSTRLRSLFSCKSFRNCTDSGSSPTRLSWNLTAAIGQPSG